VQGGEKYNQLPETRLKHLKMQRSVRKGRTPALISADRRASSA